MVRRVNPSRECGIDLSGDSEWGYWVDEGADPQGLVGERGVCRKVEEV